MATPPQLKCMQLTCATDAPPIKCSGSGASDTVASQPSPCKARLNKETIIHNCWPPTEAAGPQSRRKINKTLCSSWPDANDDAAARAATTERPRARKRSNFVEPPGVNLTFEL
ncbi:hypothetical protein EVAR_67040_1 [Eumeta japonica]|uniref:Uncharacterized protein n=1 Tax=Eumeta variegata TaxID=151549 RepID=A0A4C1ZUV1_EUMVA|nr:hypothetical protein EVAR_67040_1 [Eumeta japonica]